ncbi:glycosyltransferase family 2 protein [Hydrogenophaga laconesensis]|uniref:Cellulose synthase/poly-beta-1,6-N-acetylglucosamine synthase-like glycosyltransferase n=1 Tax=Hydrogenophaga laconesensis TaxID=1805971 RepID=A0ABU1V4H2_9BURK|nr:glycosyltransferase family 2 protein [Hydrogenophaga laconesensis]MDR7092352.1 cellulose synthase/poly-beta-1,6-N-acetylglucosamine synthase-like glycosyltransferase [Hydrogenophaga laconesensis]
MITTLISWALLATGSILLVLVALLALQVAVSLFPRRLDPVTNADAPAPSTVVLMPAHDEAEIIESMVKQALQVLPAGGRLLLVADNCTDDTAARARSAGAEVLERFDTSLRGKGYALAHGVNHLRTSPPDVVVVMDADCVAEPGSLAAIAIEAHRLQRPVQAMYDMVAPPNAGLMQRIAAFAWDFRTRLRAEGYRRLGMPCQLMGSGMAFPWPVLQQVNLATGHIVEDLKLGLDCTLAGKPPQFFPSALVSSSFPTNEQGTQSQRKRWEHGHLSMVASQAPGLLWKSLTHRNASLVALTLDMCVPPLALLTMLLSAQAVVACLLAWLGLAWPVVATVSLAGFALLALSVLAGWWKAGRRWIGFGELMSVPWYIVRKLPLYLGFLTRRQMSWIRTRRD